MDTRSLRVFAALAGTLHFGKAAEQCNLSPSALSRVVQRLEHELGCRLFERTNRAVRLTAQGRHLQSQAEEVLERMEQMQRGLADEAQALSGTISLYCSVTASYSVLAELLPAFRRRYPGVEITLHTGDEASAVRRVAQSREDIAVAARPDRLGSELRFLELATTPLVFIAPASATLPEGLSGRASVAAQRRAWGELPMIVPETGLARERVDLWFRQRGVAPRIHAQVSGNEAIAGMVALGFGCGVVPLLVLRSGPFREQLRVIDAMPALPPFRIGLCCRAQALRNPLVAALWSLAGEQVMRG
jgi:LysR family positive regulator for ilvC